MVWSFLSKHFPGASFQLKPPQQTFGLLFTKRVNTPARASLCVYDKMCYTCSILTATLIQRWKMVVTETWKNTPAWRLCVHLTSYSVSSVWHWILYRQKKMAPEYLKCLFCAWKEFKSLIRIPKPLQKPFLGDKSGRGVRADSSILPSRPR